MNHHWQFAPASGLWFCWDCFELDRKNGPAMVPGGTCTGRVHPDVEDALARWNLIDETRIKR